MMIRVLQYHDLPLFKQLRLQALLEHPEAFCSSYAEEIKLTDEEWEINFQKNVIFGAFEETQLIGCVGFFIYSSLKMKHKGGIFSMYISPSYRKRHLGDALIKKVITYAQNRVSQLHLTVVTTNDSAVRLYKKNGFKIYGTEPQALRIGEQYHDEYLMVLGLSKVGN